MTSSEISEAAGKAAEEEARERRSSRRNLAGLVVVTLISLGFVIGDIIRDLSLR